MIGIVQMLDMAAEWHELTCANSETAEAVISIVCAFALHCFVGLVVSSANRATYL